MCGVTESNNGMRCDIRLAVLKNPNEREGLLQVLRVRCVDGTKGNSGWIV